MSRKRPNAEQQTSDRSMVAGAAQILTPLAAKYPAQLEAAVTLLRTFAASKVEQPMKRRMPKKNAPEDERVAAGAFIGEPDARSFDQQIGSARRFEQ